MIDVTSDDGVTLVRLTHGKANALDLELCQAIEERFLAFAEDDSRAVILTGTGSIFSAGVDLLRLLDEGVSYVEPFLARLDGMMRAVFELPKPLVCAINGHAIAGGCLLALSGDVRLMAAGKGRIGVPELLVGVPFPPYALEIVRASVSPQALGRLVFGGTTLLPDQARENGLVDEVVSEDALLERAAEEAVRLSEVRLEAFGMAKIQLRRIVGERADALGEKMRLRTLQLWTSDETHRAIRKYLDATIRK